MKRMLSVICSLTLCIVMLAGCGEKVKGNVATVNDIDISSGTFEFYLALIKQNIAQDASLNLTSEEAWSTVEIDNQKAILFAKEKALDEIVKDTIQAERAKEAGITLNDEDKAAIQDQKNKIAVSYGGPDAFKAQLKQWGLPDAEFNTISENFVYITKLREKTYAENADISNVSDADIKEEYEKQVELYVRESIKVKHILIAFKPDNKPVRTEQEALELANSIYDKAVAGGDFDALVMEYSEDTANIEKQGEPYSFTHNDGSMVPEFDQAAYGLGIGDISKPVKTDYGYHIIKRYQADVEIPALEEVRDSMILNIKGERYSELLEVWKSEAVVVKNEDVINSI